MLAELRWKNYPCGTRVLKTRVPKEATNRNHKEETTNPQRSNPNPNHEEETKNPQRRNNKPTKIKPKQQRTNNKNKPKQHEKETTKPLSSN